MDYKDLPRNNFGDIEVDDIAFPVTLPLKKPITSAVGVTIDALTVNEPTVRQIELASKQRTDYEQTIHLTAYMCEIAPEDIRELGARDNKKLREITVPLL